MPDWSDSTPLSQSRSRTVRDRGYRCQTAHRGQYGAQACPPHRPTRARRTTTAARAQRPAPQARCAFPGVSGRVDLPASRPRVAQPAPRMRRQTREQTPAFELESPSADSSLCGSLAPDRSAHDSLSRDPLIGSRRIPCAFVPSDGHTVPNGDPETDGLRSPRWTSGAARSAVPPKTASSRTASPPTHRRRRSALYRRPDDCAPARECRDPGLSHGVQHQQTRLPIRTRQMAHDVL